MAEAIGLGASVVAFIGLAGQVAQGCKFVRDILGDVKDASNDIRALRTEIQLFELTLNHFQASLADIEAAGIPVPASYGVGIELALEYSEEAMASLLGLIAQKAGGETITTRIKFAFKKDKCSKHLGRLERAKGYVSTAQASILLLIEQHNTLDTRATHRALGSLVSTCELSITPMASIPGRFDELHTQAESIRNEVAKMRNEFSSRLHDLSTGISNILDSRFSASTNIISKSQGWEGTSYTTDEVRTAVKNLGNPSDSLKSLPMGMSEMVKDTFRGVLAEFYLDCRNTPHDCSPSKWGVVPTSGQPRSRRKVIQQTTSTRRYLRAIGIITVQSITTTFLNAHKTELSDRPAPLLSTVTRTQLELSPNPDLLRLGVYLSFIQQGFAEFQAYPEHNLRVFNIINSDAPIVAACCSGDLPGIRELFASRKASPFDRVWGDRSLLDLVLNKFFMSARVPNISTEHEAFLNRLISVFSELVQYGLDPGQQRKNDDLFGSCPLVALASLQNYAKKDTTQVSDFARIVLSRSTQDPLASYSFSPATVNSFDRLAFRVELAGVDIPLYTLLQTQDEWPIQWTPVVQLRSKYCCKVQEDLPNIFALTSSFHAPLYDILCYDPDPFTTYRVLNSCRSLRDKLVIFSSLCQLMRKCDCSSIEYQSDISSFREKLEWKFTLCLQSCQSSGLDFQNPPYAFHNELRHFRIADSLHIINRALSNFGLARELVDDLLEAELYASLVLQLAKITQRGTALRRNSPLPVPLRYYDFDFEYGNLGWAEFCNVYYPLDLSVAVPDELQNYDKMTYLEPSPDKDSSTSLDSDCYWDDDDDDESDTWSDFQNALQYPWDYDDENFMETMFSEPLDADHQHDPQSPYQTIPEIDTHQVQMATLYAVVEERVAKSEEIVGFEVSRSNDSGEEEKNATEKVQTRYSAPDVIDERFDGITVAWNAFWT